ncbi:MAG: hypothetical protein HY354_06985 [Planctomycetes bacterium]|nr:hypothetical protein [Planctomycetota bacterium]
MISKFLPLVGITVIMTLFIVWEQVQTTKCGYKVAELQKKITDLQEKNRRLECQVSALKKPERVVNAIQSMGIDLAQPLENKDMIAKTKQPGPQRGRTTNTIVASARAELGPLGRGKEVKKQKGGKVKR